MSMRTIALTSRSRRRMAPSVPGGSFGSASYWTQNPFSSGIVSDTGECGDTEVAYAVGIIASEGDVPDGRHRDELSVTAWAAVPPGRSSYSTTEPKLPASHATDRCSCR